MCGIFCMFNADEGQTSDFYHKCVDKLLHNRGPDKAETEDKILKVFETIEGPFSIICLSNSKLYFARDSLGRNSLILGKKGDMCFLSSVMSPFEDAFEAIELPSLGIFCYDIKSKEINLFPYFELNHPHHQTQLKLVTTFYSSLSLQRQIKLKWKEEKVLTTPKFSFNEVTKSLSDSKSLFENLLRIPEIYETCDIFLELLSKSVKDRVEQTPKLCKDCLYQKVSSCCHCHVGILFSELRKLAPNRRWNFIEINVTRDELGDNIKKLSSLVFPLSNVLDESLGAALYFASRGVGTCDGLLYQSTCRVILIGSGADELFGGYTRHRNAFKRSTENRDLLKEELDLDWARLPSRNLARDDRVIGDNGITSRAPFIEEKFVNFVQQLQPLQRCYPALVEGVGDKLLLRLCAYKLGLTNCSSLRKRALQFGSRIADKKQSATDISMLLLKSSINSNN
ncbi:CLUMA_CG001325, isoform A [Clunio marinus]|uniref:CLUMA_CG001325, isoform A n=1 Tax=Clunio marinus TaxID=568069 RepID=A0A1J1HJD9_9DIPT|nr:CLUMA_CG001325, isoform A [Clunio marinus]